jgi:hypothetical protein
MVSAQDAGGRAFTVTANERVPVAPGFKKPKVQLRSRPTRAVIGMEGLLETELGIKVVPVGMVSSMTTPSFGEELVFL